MSERYKKEQVTEEELEFRKEYLTKLIEYLQLQTQLGYISSDEASSQVNAAIKDVLGTKEGVVVGRWTAPSGYRFPMPQAGSVFTYATDELKELGLMPYIKEFAVSDIAWQEKLATQREEIRKGEVTRVSRTAAKQEGMNQLLPYLNALKSQGQITEKEKQEELSKAQEALNKGIKWEDLPIASDVKNYRSGQDDWNQMAAYQQGLTGDVGATQRAEAGYGYYNAREQGWQNAIGGQRENPLTGADARDYWESQRQLLVSQFTDTRDWIKRWTAQHMVNPYATPERTNVEQASYEVNRLQNDVERLGYMQESMNKQPGGATSAERAALNDAIVYAHENLAMWQGTEEKELATMGGGEGHLEPAVGSPTTPTWLARLVPELAGKPFYPNSTRANLPTPSGQQWANTPPSEKAMYAGYADWIGASYEDIINQMERMQPVTPTGQGRWRPQRQRMG